MYHVEAQRSFILISFIRSSISQGLCYAQEQRFPKLLALRVPFAGVRCIPSSLHPSSPKREKGSVSLGELNYPAKLMYLLNNGILSAPHALAAHIKAHLPIYSSFSTPVSLPAPQSGNHCPLPLYPRLRTAGLLRLSLFLPIQYHMQVCLYPGCHISSGHHSDTFPKVSPKYHNISLTIYKSFYPLSTTY